MLVSQAARYRKGHSVDPARPLIGNGLASSDGDLWRRQRRLMQPAFHRRRLAGLVDDMVAVADRLLDQWLADPQPQDLTLPA